MNPLLLLRPSMEKTTHLKRGGGDGADTDVANPSFLRRRRRPILYSILSLFLSLYLILLLPPSRPPTLSSAAAISFRPSNPNTPPPPAKRCSGRYIYMHDLPPRFNVGMIPKCSTLSQWANDTCQFSVNGGLGASLPINSTSAFFSGSGSSSWHATNQYSLEVIFHSRMKSYDCLTNNSSLAAAVFVPFYAGIDLTSHLLAGNSFSVRDSSPLSLAGWLTSRPEWAAMGGRDHFLVAGRTAWDFRRRDEDGEAGWGNKLLLLPPVANMTVLITEANPWQSNGEPTDVSIPYPTYFHPASDREVVEWREKVRRARRPWLFSFAGAPRANMTDSIRGRLMEQCRDSRRCKLLDCGLDERPCHSPEKVMRVFGSSEFCLQPIGDSYTRRSAFDAMVAGCVPVFFDQASAYLQYPWHLPENGSRYSVLIPEEGVREGRVRVEEVLMRYGEEVRKMREEVVRLIPSLVYADPKGRMEREKDAFVLAVEGVMRRVERRREMSRGKGKRRKVEDGNDSHFNYSIS